MVPLMPGPAVQLDPFHVGEPPLPPPPVPPLPPGEGELLGSLLSPPPPPPPPANVMLVPVMEDARPAPPLPPPLTAAVPAVVAPPPPPPHQSDVEPHDPDAAPLPPAVL